MDGKDKDAPPRLCSRAQITLSLGFSNKSGQYSPATTTPLTASSKWRLFPVPQAEIHIEMMMIWLHRDKRKFANGPESDTKQGLHDWLPKLEETLAAVYLSWAGEYFEGGKSYYLINEIRNIWWWRKFKIFLNPHLQHTYTLTETARCSHTPTFIL
jgi:hypothetical protein